MSLTIGIGCLGYIHMGLLQRAMHFRTTAIINFAGQVLQVIVSIVLAMAGWHYWALVWGSRGADGSRGSGCLVDVPMDTESAGSRLGHRFRVEVRDERLFAFCFQLLDSQHGQPSCWLAIWRSGTWIL